MKVRKYELPSDLDDAARKNTGAFYTPDDIVDFMVTGLLEGRSLPLKICDFSCGGGAFLQGVLRYVRKNAPHLYNECAAQLTAVDINPGALELARKNLPDIPEENFLCADTLDLRLPRNKKFDIIIGNPPYRCGGVKNNAAFPPERQKELKEKFPCSFEYKMNLFALFIEQGTRMADEFSLIVPDSLLCGRYFSRLRRFLAEKFFIRELILLEKPAFDAAPGNAVIIHARRGTLPAAPALRCGSFTRKELADKKKEFHLTDQRRFLSESRCRFQLAFSDFEEKLAAKLLAPAPRVRDLFNFSSGIISKGGKRSIVTRTPADNAFPGIVYGREIHPFEIRYEGNFLRLDRENIKSGLSHSRFQGKKIFLRQTGNRLVAAVTEEPFYALNNCHVGTGAGNFPLESLAALLNSSVLNFLYRFLSGERNRNFAQIDIDLLNELPLRRSHKFDLFAPRCTDSPEAREELDSRCAALYGLTPEEAEWIKK